MLKREKGKPPDQSGQSKASNYKMHLINDKAYCQDMREYIPNACCSDHECVFSNSCSIIRQGEV